ncbi:hypothetical protein PLEOSDRAFT_1038990, partial [Pleurotus ostreatus PC15]
ASGLLYLSELIEEHSRIAKLVGERGIYAIIGLHVLLYLADSLPLTHVAFSVACHVVYLQNFSSTWPVISLTSISFVSSCVLVIADHFLWFFHFSRLANYNKHARTYRETGGQYSYGFGEIATFFALCVWLAPLFLFLSLSANDNALPVSSGMFKCFSVCHFTHSSYSRPCNCITVKSTTRPLTRVSLPFNRI